MEGQIKHLSDAIGLCYGYFLSHVSVACKPDSQKRMLLLSQNGAETHWGEWPAQVYITRCNMSDAFTDVVKPAIENESTAFWLHDC